MKFLSKLKSELRVQAIVGEFMGTAILLFLGCLGCIPSGLAFQGSLLFGVALTIAIQICGHISGGHFNPAVTISAFIYGLISIRVGLAYIAAQLAGATVGFGLARVTAPKVFGLSESLFCNTVPHPDLALHECFLIEFFCTFLLVLVCCSVWDKRREDNRDFIPLKFGFFIFGAVLVAGPLTGASFNPARTFGPSLINNNWDTHWLYWLAPVGGACASVIVYKVALLVRAQIEENQLDPL